MNILVNGAKRKERSGSEICWHRRKEIWNVEEKVILELGGKNFFFLRQILAAMTQKNFWYMRQKAWEDRKQPPAAHQMGESNGRREEMKCPCMRPCKFPRDHPQTLGGTCVSGGSNY